MPSQLMTPSSVPALLPAATSPSKIQQAALQRHPHGSIRNRISTAAAIDNLAVRTTEAEIEQQRRNNRMLTMELKLLRCNQDGQRELHF